MLHFGLIMTDKRVQTDKRMAERWKGLPDKQAGAAIDTQISLTVLNATEVRMCSEGCRSACRSDFQPVGAAN